MNRSTIITLIFLSITAAAIPASFIAAPYPDELVLQHIPTTIAIAALMALVILWKPSSTFVACSLAFLWLHLIGARWIYSFVPYDDAAKWLTGHTVSDAFGFKRNHYDRLVHFASGLLGVPIAAEIYQRTTPVGRIAAVLIAIQTVMTVGAIYEVLEWQIAMMFSPEMAESYNGQQGDIWDAQKDLALAFLGAVVAAVTITPLSSSAPMPVHRGGAR